MCLSLINAWFERGASFGRSIYHSTIRFGMSDRAELMDLSILEGGERRPKEFELILHVTTLTWNLRVIESL